MPNIKSAIKRVRIARLKTMQNTAKRSALKTAIKKCGEAIKLNDENTASVLSATSKTIDKAASKHIIHKNTAARRKSKLAKALNVANK